MRLTYEDQFQDPMPGTSGYGYGARYAPYLSWAGLHKALSPLLHQLRQYDGLRSKLERNGGTLDDLQRINGVLNEEIQLGDVYHSNVFRLTEQQKLRAAIRDMAGLDLRVDVRQLDTGMPVYYLCRTSRDYWAEYSLVVEDIYESPGHPMVEERFVRLMDSGHETFYLRLSQFREQVMTQFGGSGDQTEWHTDHILYQAGRHVFQAAWHEDQRPGFLTAAHFGLHSFRQAVELLYLCLSGELCELRGAADERMAEFFKEIYPQPAIHALLRMLSSLDGQALSSITEKATCLYPKLAAAFGHFIAIKVPWGRRNSLVPLYKLLFGNIFRLDKVAQALRDDERLRDGVYRLEEQSQDVICQVLSDGVHLEGALRTALGSQA